MTRVVAKFGGTSVGSIERIRHSARLIQHAVEQGETPIVVVSAMSGETDRLLTLSSELGGGLGDRETDVALAAGEQVSASLMALALRELGLKSRSIMGWQAPVVTTGPCGHPNIMEKIPTPECARSIGCLCGQSHLIVMGSGLVWFALAFERLGDAERALAFANESLVVEGPGGPTDLSTGANPCVWTHALAYSVRGRILAACGDVSGAEQAFRAADASASSHDYWFLEFLAAKDLFAFRERFR